MAVSYNNKRVSVKLSNETRNKLKQLAELDKRTLSNYIEVILEEYLKNIKD